MPIPRVLPVAAVLTLCSAAPAQHTLVADGAARSVDVWAAKGMMQSPVSICFDPFGNLYIAETDRAGNAVQDTRGLDHLNAVEEDLRFQSVDDRRDQIHRWVAQGAFAPDYFTKTEDRVRVLSDTDGDGKADAAKLFAGGFNDELDGIGAGLLWLNSTLYYTCIPHLWALPDANHDLQADARQSLASGFGVRWCFFGHDLHGLVPGPDGRIYFSMGDRGFNITTKEGNSLIAPDQGGVFRCWPDGSELELFYRGLRNPQELAFSELGDLFTGDNNCDSGDKARIVHIVEGGDSGWRQDVQSLDSRGPWNREFMWYTLAEKYGPERPAWALPPIEYMCAGPSGLALYPGTGESHAYDGCFFLADFRGGDSSIHAFRCTPDGASFKVTDHVEYFKGIPTITDIAWGYDGRLYMSDWGGGWSPNPNGVVLTVTNTTVHDDPQEAAAIAQVGELFKSGFAQRSPNDLLSLLAHRDQRVRLAAQYELASRGVAVGELASIAGDATSAIVTRAHAIWALGQMARKDVKVVVRLSRLLGDPDAEVRTQALRTLGDLPRDLTPGMAPGYNGFLKDPDPRVRLAAAIAIARHGDRTSVAPLLDLLAANDNANLTLRHAASYALSTVAKPDDLALRARSMNGAARLGAVLALRLMDSNAVVAFLDDEAPTVAIEAARAIYDLRLAFGIPRLAASLDSPIPLDRATEPFLRRAIEANVLLGTDDCATRLAAFAADKNVASEWRLLAIERLDAWDQPLKREGVWGNWANLPARSSAAADAATNQHIDAILAAAADDEELLSAGYRLQVHHAFHLAPADMPAHIADARRPDIYRLTVLETLASASPTLAANSARSLLATDSSATGPLRWRAMEALAKAAPDASTVELLRRAALSGPIRDRQHAVKALATITSEPAAAAITALANDLRLGWLDREIGLEVYNAALALPEDAHAHVLAEAAGIHGSRPPGYATNLLAAGGDPVAGREIFQHHASAECIRCHTAEGPALPTAPSLAGVGARLSADRLVESIVEPGAVVASGYGQVSAMPVMTQYLSPAKVRDVVAYLKTLDGSTAAENPAPAPHAPPTPAHTERAPETHAEPSNLATRILAFVLAVLVTTLIWRALTRRA